MFEKILVGFDGSDQGRDALALGGLLAEAAGGVVTAAYVYESLGVVPHPGFGEWMAELRADAERILAGAGEEVMHEAIEATSPARGLHDLAEDEEADLLVVGSCHRGPAGRVLVGSVGERLLHGSPCAVAVAPLGFAEHKQRGIGVIAVGYDGGEEARIALAAAARLAQDTGATLRLVGIARTAHTVIETHSFEAAPELLNARRKHLDNVMKEAAESLPAGVAAETSIATGVTEELGEIANVDLLFVGSRGYGPLRRVLLGSTAATLTHHADYPVIVFPRGAHGVDEHEAPESAVAAKTTS